MSSLELTKKEKQAAEAYFAEPVNLDSSVRFTAGRLATWKCDVFLHTMRVCTFRKINGTVLIPNSSDEIFKLVLAELAPEITTLSQMSDLIERTSPAFRKVILCLKPYMEDIDGIWHTPEMEDCKYSAFLDNSTSGKLEKITLCNNAPPVIEEVGCGLKFLFS
ncbi:hypothetical protein FNU76_01630 [Chitinimonas arctica]|uniref:Uncharacterized protein n=1 Tax=Chitinimonas arctica TaxID=2594795 RepID=A0A516SAI8_9NEIS|nr:hypothetical protein [Chitinimonas arctica]QDQ25161.1 hypothetical protein FNU76_01630 [Chitinimonas arctica]